MATTLISIAEYLATSYDPECEYIDGILQGRNLGEYDHARLQTVLVAWFLRREREWNIQGVVEQRIVVSLTRVRVPDVTIIDRAQPVGQILIRPPLIVIEVLSPEDTWRRVGERVTDYLDVGVPHIWILDPGPRRAWVATRSGFEETRLLQVARSGIAVPLDELFREFE
jgi:Uma2 family endonuclease